MTQNERYKKFVQKRRSENKCIDCGKPLDRQGYRCTQCNAKLNEEQRKRRQFLKKIGICPRCGKNKLYGDEKVCLECGANEYATAMSSRERLGKDHYNEVHRNWSYSTYQKRKEEGICTRCGKRKADYGLTTCGICRAKDNATRLKRQPHKPPRSERYKQRLCYFCDNPIKDGYKVCEKHYQMNCEKQKLADRTYLRNSNDALFKI